MKTDPKKVLDALLSGGEVGVPATAEELDRARALAQADAPEPAQVERLPEPLALAVLEASLRRRHPALAEALAGASSKPLAKAAKRALYALRSAGLEIAPPRAEPEPPPRPAPAPAEELPALLSAITGTGERALILTRPIRGGGLESFHFIFTDEAGVTELKAGELSRSDFRRTLKELRGDKRAPVMEISRDRAREVLAGALAANLRSGEPLPKGADEALRHLDVRAGGEPPPLPPPEDGDATLALEGRSLHDQPEIATWLPPERELRALAARLDEVTASPLELSDAQRKEQLASKVRGSVEGFFTPEVKRLYARRLWEMAEYFDLTGRPEPTRVARAEARRLFHGAPGSSGFCDFLFEKVLLLTQRARAGEPLPGPGEGLTPSAPPERRSPGGLILP